MKPSNGSILFLIASFMLFAACASRPAKMVPEDLHVHRRHDGTVLVKVTGEGAVTADTAAFTKAVETAILESGLFSGVDRTPAHWIVEVATVFRQPAMGFNMTVSLGAHWILRDQSTQQMVWQSSITTEHTATMGDAFAGPARLRLATEGAVRANIRRAMDELASLDLPAR